MKAARGREEATGTIIADLINRLWPSELPAPLISSFRPRALAAARACAPDIARGMLFSAVPKNCRTLAETLGCMTIHANHQRLNAKLVSEICRSGYPLLAYTVNDRGLADTLFDWGVTAVFSDAPDCLLDGEARRVPRLPNAGEAVRAGILWQGSVR